MLPCSIQWRYRIQSTEQDASAIVALHMRPLHRHLWAGRDHRFGGFEDEHDIQYFFSMSFTVKPRVSR